MSRKLAWITEFLFVIATACTRASILFFYRKIIGRANLPKVKLAVSALLWFIIAYSVVFLLILLFGYRPLSAYWLSMDPSYTEYSGGYNEAISLPICAGISTVSDFGVLILPFFFVQGLQVAKGKKV